MRCYCAATRQVARRLTRFYEAELRSVGMNPAQFELMANLQGRPRVSQSELAAAMDVDQTTLSRNLKLLVGLGWVSVGASATDGRRSEYALSAEGVRVFRRAVPCWERAMAKVEERLGGKAAGVWGMLERLGAATESAGTIR
jgi:DNA-binding MarR family transcriptional regulator